MKYTFDCDRWGSSFSVPSKVVDKYIKLSDGDFVKAYSVQRNVNATVQSLRKSPGFLRTLSLTL